MRYFWLVAFLAACSGKPKDTTVTATSKKTPSVEETSIIDSSYIMGIARNTQELETLGAKSGWPEFFQGRYIEALDAFEERANEVDAQFGAARSALALAEGFNRTRQIQAELTPLVVQAQGSRPGAEVMTAWHTYVMARAGKADTNSKGTGGIADELVELLATKSNNFGVEAAAVLDKHGSEQLASLQSRIKLRESLQNQSLKRMKRRMGRLDYRVAGIKVNSGGQNFQLWDPGVSDIPSRYYAQYVLGTLNLSGLCPATIRARALLLLGRPSEAITLLDSGLEGAAQKPAISCVILSDALGELELVHIAKALRIRALFAAGKPELAEKSLKELKASTLAQRVRRHWAGGNISEGAETSFSRDRLKRGFDSAIGLLGNSAVGATDLAELGIIERYVDVIQRMQADAFIEDDMLARAAKMRNGARQAGKGFVVNGRNTFDALMAGALDHLRISQPRVALKYLTKTKGYFGVTEGLAEQLRDVLSFRAMMKQDGTPARGQ